MMMIDWLPTADGTAKAALSLPDLHDVAMAIDFARIIEDSATGQGGGTAGFVIKDADGATLFHSVSGSVEVGPLAAAEAGVPPPAPMTKEPVPRAEVKLALSRAAGGDVVRKRKAPAAPVSAASESAPEEQASPMVEAIVSQPSVCEAPKRQRPSVAELRIFDAPSPKQALEQSSESGGWAATLSAVRQNLASFAAKGREAVAPLQVAATKGPSGSAGEAIDAPAAAQKLGVSRLVAADVPPEKRRIFADHVDYWVLGTAAALLLIVGSPIYSVYATMSQVKAAEGRVIGGDIDVAHLRGSLIEEPTPARLAEGRSVARATGPIRLVGIKTTSAPDVVVDTLGAMARGPAFATVSTGEKVDFRKLFWHLRVVSPSRIDVRLYDARGDSRPQTLVFRRTTFWAWKLFDVRDEHGV